MKLLNEAPPDGGAEASVEENTAEPETNEFADLANDYARADLDGDEASPESELAEAPDADPVETETQPEVQEKEATPTPEKAEPEPEPPPEPVATKEVPKEATPESEPAPSQEEMQKQFEEYEAKSLSQLEKFYGVSEEDLPKLVAEPETVLPKMLARAHFSIMMAVGEVAQNMIPQAVASVLDQRKAQESFEDSFHSQWGAIDKNNPDHMRVAEAAVKAVRAMNPQASMEEVIKAAGQLTYLQLGLQDAPPPAADEGKTRATPTPVERRVLPASPSAPGAVGDSRDARTIPENEFAELASAWAQSNS